MALPRVRVIKQFTYRGATQEWSNTYHFTGGDPIDEVTWNNLCDILAAHEKSFLPGTVTFLRAECYRSDSNALHLERLLSGVGSWSAPGTPQYPGDCAAVLRWSTAAKTTRGHPIYLYNYYHAVHGTAGDPDAMEPTQKQAIGVFATAFQNGIAVGAQTFTRCGPRGANAVGHLVLPDVSHRDFPR